MSTRKFIGGDRVKIIRGKYKGCTGVLKSYPNSDPHDIVPRIAIIDVLTHDDDIHKTEINRQYLEKI